jgi:hypothetical protein
MNISRGIFIFLMVPLKTNEFLELMLSLIVHVPLRQAAIRNGQWTLPLQGSI